MANTIKLKQGSGSDPSASDLVLGEPAIRTDTGEIFLKKDDGSIAKVAGGIDDGDKGDITVSNDGATFTIDNDAVTYAKIQNVSATNRILGRDSSGAGVIEEITPANLRTMINVADGATNVTNTNQLTNGAGFITATLTNEQVQDIVGGMVTGNTESGITVTYQDGDGTLDFSVASQTDNNFTNADHSKLDGIEAGATADQSASEILTLLKTVDGAGSGLDADTLDGISSGSFLRSDANDSTSGTLTFSVDSTDIINFTATSSNNNRGIAFNSRTALSADHNDGYLRLNNNNEFSNGVFTPLVMRADGGFNVDGNTSIDGSGNYVRGLSGASDYSSLLRSDANDTASGKITFSGGDSAVGIAANSDIRLANGNWTGNSTKIQHHNHTLYIQGGAGSNNSKVILFRDANGSDRWYIDNSGHFYPNVDGTYDIGSSSIKVRVGYFNEVDSGEVRVNNGILETKAAIATSHTLTADYNALAVSPTINNGVTVTVPSGAVWAIV
tara:strand:+ start:1564 stop:3063 length:1500 start_codon:yes stop_codon:yes gene_type:complete